ncbi:MAG: hypothetical protein WC796_05390 [Candidatus Pacearchaeota archaeon]|jgi:hypothetical protein
MERSSIILGVLAAVVLIVINFFALSSENKVFAISSLVLLLAIVFLGLLILNRAYHRISRRVDPLIILAFCYTVLAATILSGTRYFSVEWAFLAFIFSAVVFYDFKIDSRFLLLPGLLVLGYIPFLLIGKQNALAENMAVYVYYFLIIGVLMQIFENFKKRDNYLDFEKVMTKILERMNWIIFIVIVGMFSVCLIIINRFTGIDLWKWTSVYLFVVVLAFYVVSLLVNKPFQAK